MQRGSLAMVSRKEARDLCRDRISQTPFQNNFRVADRRKVARPVKPSAFSGTDSHIHLDRCRDRTRV